MKHPFLTKTLLVLVLCAAAAPTLVAQPQTKPLFVKSNLEGIAPVADSLYLQTMQIRFDIPGLKSQNNEEFEIILPGVTRAVRIKKENQASNEKFGAFTWFGQIRGEPTSYVSFTIRKDAVSGYIRTQAGKVYEIIKIGHQLHQIAEVNLQLYKPDSENQPLAVLGASQHQNLRLVSHDCCDDSGIIDVLVIYTTKARIRARGENEITGRIIQSVDITNQSFIKSNIKSRIELAGAVEVNYPGEGWVIQDLERINNAEDGYLDTIQKLRDDFKADIVVLMISERRTTDMGAATVMTSMRQSFADSAYCVVDLTASTARLVFPHEIGHLLGAGHECEEGRSARLGLFNESHCYSNGSFGTIMAVKSDIPKIEQWSNPSVLYPLPGGVPTGDLSATCPSNNAATIDSTLAFVSLFRCRNKCDGTPRIRTITTTDSSSETTATTAEASDERIVEENTSARSWFIGLGIALLLAFILLIVARRRKKQ